MQFSAQSDRLGGMTAGQHGARRVVLVHGFTQTGGCFGPLAADLAADHEVVLPDLPGHGASTDHAEADLWTGADLLAASCGRAVYVGYSMGARLCLHLALAHPDTVAGLVLIGATAGIADEAERNERLLADHRLAAHVEAVGIDVFIDEWVGMPMFAGLPDWAHFPTERRRNSAGGLAESLRRAGTGSMDPLWDRLGEIDAPTLCLVGGTDAAYVPRADAIATGIGARARVATIAAAGHAAHLEAPGVAIVAVRHFLSDSGASDSGASDSGVTER